MAVINAFVETNGQQLHLLNNALVVILPKKPDAALSG
jgi:hypothetical protein